MIYRFQMPPEQIHFFAHILESYEDVGVVTTEVPAVKRADGKSGKAIVIANVADDYAALFERIVASLDLGPKGVVRITERSDV